MKLFFTPVEPKLIRVVSDNEGTIEIVGFIKPDRDDNIVFKPCKRFRDGRGFSAEDLRLIAYQMEK